MKKAAARVCFHISYSRALKTGMLEGSWCRITHLQGTDQACNPSLGKSPIDGFQFFCEAAAFVFKGKAGFWAQVESNSLPAVSWAVTLCVCTCCSPCGGTEIFQLMEDWANPVYSGLFSQDSRFPQGLSQCQLSGGSCGLWSKTSLSCSVSLQESHSEMYQPLSTAWSWLEDPRLAVSEHVPLSVLQLKT